MTCEICGGSGFVRQDVPVYDPNFGKLVACRCKTQENAARMQVNWGSSLDRSLGLADFLVRGEGSKRMLSAARSFIANPTQMVTVYGDAVTGQASSANGNGKTTWAQIIVNECIRRGVVAVYITASDAVEYLKGGIQDKHMNVEARLQKLTDVPVLALDELTQARWTEWVSDQLSTLIDRRYRLHGRGTLLVMDERPSENLHPRLISRMREGVVIKNSDTDMRPSLGGELL